MGLKNYAILPSGMSFLVTVCAGIILLVLLDPVQSCHRRVEYTHYYKKPPPPKGWGWDHEKGKDEKGWGQNKKEKGKKGYGDEGGWGWGHEKKKGSDDKKKGGWGWDQKKGKDEKGGWGKKEKGHGGHEGGGAWGWDKGKSHGDDKGGKERGHDSGWGGWHGEDHEAHAGGPGWGWGHKGDDEGWGWGHEKEVHDEQEHKEGGGGFGDDGSDSKAKGVQYKQSTYEMNLHGNNGKPIPSYVLAHHSPTIHGYGYSGPYPNTEYTNPIGSAIDPPHTPTLRHPGVDVTDPGFYNNSPLHQQQQRGNVMSSSYLEAPTLIKKLPIPPSGREKKATAIRSTGTDGNFDLNLGYNNGYSTIAFNRRSDAVEPGVKKEKKAKGKRS